MPERDVFDATLIEFRPLTNEDLPRLCTWFNAPHARRWFGNGRTLASVVEEYTPYVDGRTPVHAFVVSHAARPIGMVQWERFGDFPDFMQTYRVDDPDVVNCDVLIGETDAVHRGLGAPLIRRFLKEVVFRDTRYSTCLIDPETANHIAIRAYEKAGFRYVRTLADDGEGKPVYLMELQRADLMR
jgi:RimJ/RimL family protein N-acetyltransferase